MIAKTEILRAPDGKKLFCYQWTPDEGVPVKAAVSVVHGMAEHAARYERLARVLCGAGYAVYAHDQRGHGKTAETLDAIGRIAESDGLGVLLEDVHAINGKLREDFPGLPVFLFAHSMGSFVAQGYVQKYGTEIAGLILSGSNGKMGPITGIARVIAKGEIKKHGREKRSEKLNKLSFGSFNDAFKPNRTAFDWLSGDSGEVDKYIRDPYCGDVFPAGYFYDFVVHLDRIHRASNVAKVPVSLPILLLAGEKDPVGGKRGVGKLYRMYRKRGVADLEMKIYPGKRHEILNETNRDEVMNDILERFDSCLAK